MQEVSENRRAIMGARVLWEKRLRCGVWLRVVMGDLTEEQVDAIVNAANSQLAHGGGVAGAIVRRGGPSIQEESDRLAPVPVGEAVVTGSGNLPALAVIHAVGPRMGEGDEDAKLENAVANSLDLACRRGFRSISLPAISSGIFGYPKDRCAQVLLRTTVAFFEDDPEVSLREVRFCNFDEATCSIFLQHFRKAEPDLPLAEN